MHINKGTLHCANGPCGRGVSWTSVPDLAPFGQWCAIVTECSWKTTCTCNNLQLYVEARLSYVSGMDQLVLCKQDLLWWVHRRRAATVKERMWWMNRKEKRNVNDKSFWVQWARLVFSKFLTVWTLCAFCGIRVFLLFVRDRRSSTLNSPIHPTSSSLDSPSISFNLWCPSCSTRIRSNTVYSANKEMESYDESYLHTSCDPKD